MINVYISSYISSSSSYFQKHITGEQEVCVPATEPWAEGETPLGNYTILQPIPPHHKLYTYILLPSYTPSIFAYVPNMTVVHCAFTPLTLFDVWKFSSFHFLTGDK